MAGSAEDAIMQLGSASSPFASSAIGANEVLPDDSPPDRGGVVLVCGE